MVLTQSDFEAIKNLIIFDGLPEDRVRAIASDCRMREFPQRHTLFVMGERADHFFAIISGWVKLYRTLDGGQEVVIEVFGPGESFAEAAIFDTRTYPVSAEIVAEARLLEVPAEPFLERIQNEPDLCHNMFANFFRRLRGLISRTEQAKGLNTSQRLAAFLMKFAGTTGASELHLPYDKHLIAARLDMQPETLSRAFAALKEHGVTVTGDIVRIEDGGALRRLLKGER